MGRHRSLRRLQEANPEQPHSGLVWGLSRYCKPHRNLLLSKFTVDRWAVAKSYGEPLKLLKSPEQEGTQDSQQEERRTRHQ